MKMDGEIQKRLDGLKNDTDFKEIQSVFLKHGFHLADEVLTGLPTGRDNLPESGMFIYERPSSRESYCIHHDRRGQTYIENSQGQEISIGEIPGIGVDVHND